MVSEKIFKFSHYKSMGTISRHGGHPNLRTVTIFTNFQSPFNTMLHIKFEELWPRGFSRSKVWTDGQTDDGRRVIIIAHSEPLAQTSKKKKKKKSFKRHLLRGHWPEFKVISQKCSTRPFTKIAKTLPLGWTKRPPDLQIEKPLNDTSSLASGPI